MVARWGDRVEGGLFFVRWAVLHVYMMNGNDAGGKQLLEQYPLVGKKVCYVVHRGRKWFY